MRYLLRLIIYLSFFLLTFSVSQVLLFRFVPVTVTPLKVIRYVENFSEMGPKVYSGWVPLSAISTDMQTAVMATEDNNFLIHNGFDWDAIGKARKSNSQGERLRGASTITQQTAKNVFCTPDRNYVRKAIEAYYAVLMEVFWNKERIMEVYLNVVETGENMYGVEAPARKVYNKKAAELNRYEASMIASVLPNPIRMKLENPSNYMIRRAAQVRSLMNMLPPLDYENPIPPTAPKKVKANK